MGVPGLRLNLGGAPLTPHVIDGVEGLYWPTHHTPIDLLDTIDHAKATELHNDPGVPLELGEIPDEATAEQHRQIYRAEIDLAARAGGDTPAPVGAESDYREAQVAAIAPVPVNTEPAAAPEGQPETE